MHFTSEALQLTATVDVQAHQRSVTFTYIKEWKIANFPAGNFDQNYHGNHSFQTLEYFSGILYFTWDLGSPGQNL